jgi:hypothetical protein
MLLQEIETDVAPAEVIRLANGFFVHGGNCGGCPEDGGPTHARYQVTAGEVVIAASRTPAGRTLVRGSASRGASLVGSFLCTLGRPADVRRLDPRARRRSAR